MAVVGDTLPHCTGTGTQADPYIFTSAEGFVEAIAVTDSYIEAGQTGLTFDCNGGVLTAPFEMHCIYLDGKGLTILNALLQNTDYPIIYYPTSVTGRIVNIKNINVYNYCIIGLGYCISLVGGYYWSDNKNNQMKYKFNNCHFAGISIGYPKLSGSVSYYYNFLGTGNDNNYVYVGEYSYKDCTFNHHIKQQGDGAGVFCLIGYSPKAEHASGCSLYMDNCVLCLSGYNKGAISSYEGTRSDVQFNNTTIKNSVNNKLKCGGKFRFITNSGDYAGYNYFKMYVESEKQTAESIYVGNTQTLINSSRLVIPSTGATIRLEGIVMQEDDPTADNYIYNDQNLKAKGFLVGQVIT